MAGHQPTDPVTYYQGEDLRLPLRLRNALVARRAEVVEFLAKGSAQSFDAYRFHVGRIQALDEAIAQCDEFARQLSRGN